MDNGKTTWKLEPLQPVAIVQETNPLIYNNHPRKPAGWKSDLQEAQLLSLTTIQEAKQ